LYEKLNSNELATKYNLHSGRSYGILPARTYPNCRNSTYAFMLVRHTQPNRHYHIKKEFFYWLTKSAYHLPARVSIDKNHPFYGFTKNNKIALLQSQNMPVDTHIFERLIFFSRVILRL